MKDAPPAAAAAATPEFSAPVEIAPGIFLENAQPSVRGAREIAPGIFLEDATPERPTRRRRTEPLDPSSSLLQGLPSQVGAPAADVGMEGPTADTQSGRVVPGSFRANIAETRTLAESLSRLAGDDPALKNTYHFAEALSRFADQYAIADDEGNAEALAQCARSALECGQRLAETFEGHVYGTILGLQDAGIDQLEFHADLASYPAETLARVVEGVKSLAILSVKIGVIGAMAQDNPELALEAFDRHVMPQIQPVISHLEAMTGPERTRFITRALCNLLAGKYLSVGMQMPAEVPIPHLEQVIDGANEIVRLIASELESARRISNFENLPASIKAALTPLATTMKDSGKLMQIAQQRGREFINRIVMTLSERPDLVVTEGSLDGAVAKIVGDFEREAAEEMASFRRAEEATAPSAGQAAGIGVGEGQTIRTATKNIVGTTFDEIKPTQSVVNRQKVDEYARKLLAGEPVAPIVVYEVPGRGRFISEGHHRFIASKQTGIPVNMIIQPGGGAIGLPNWNEVVWKEYISEGQFWDL